MCICYLWIRSLSLSIYIYISESAAMLRFILSLLDLQLSTLAKYEVGLIYYHHPLINPIVNPADILPVNGIVKFVIAKYVCV
jgi:hypothetical protein